MDLFLYRTDFDWTLKAALCLAIGLGPALAVIFAPLEWFKYIVRIPTFTPNGTTMWGTQLFFLGVWIFFNVDLTIGYELIVFGSMLDIADGRAAKAMKVYCLPRSSYDIWVGMWLDPLMDKCKYLYLIWVFTVAGFVTPWLAWPIIGFDSVGTLMRPPFDFWIKKKETAEGDDSPVRTTAATAAGKVKATLQAFGLVTCGPNHMGWVTSTLVPNIMFGLALFAGFVSVLSRLRTSPTLHRIIDRIGRKFFSHQD